MEYRIIYFNVIHWRRSFSLSPSKSSLSCCLFFLLGWFRRWKFAHNHFWCVAQSRIAMHLKTTVRRKSKPLLVNQVRDVIKKVLNHCLVIKTEPKHDRNIVRLTIIRAWIMTIKSPSNELNQTLESLSWPPWFPLSATLLRGRGCLWVMFDGLITISKHFCCQSFSVPSKTRK